MRPRNPSGTGGRGGGAGGASIAAAAVRDGDLLSSGLEPVGPRASIGGLLARNLTFHRDRPVLRQKRAGAFESTTWGRLACDVASLAAFLRARGVGEGDRVAVVTRNRSEMLVTEFAVMGIGAVFTPIFHAFSAEQIGELIGHSGAAVAFAGRDQLGKLLGTPSLRVLVGYGPGPPPDGGALNTVSFEDALSAHRAAGPDDPLVVSFLETASALDPDAPCLMMYTSGTSGKNKGVLLSHENILSQQRALARVWSVTPDDRMLTYLPWHHSFGGIFEKYTALYNGVPLALDDSYGKDFDVLLANWKAIQPTLYFSVPKIHQQLVDHVQLHPEEEAEVFHPELRFVFTAAAPLPAKISEFFAKKRIPVIEGWGLTETSPCCTLTDMNESRSIPGMVGYPIPGVTLKLAPDGEILVRGANVMRGYHDDPEATASCLPGDGWFHTGDLGELVDRGLKLITRKDRVFKMLNAEKVVPTVLENRLAGLDRYIQHVIVVGNGRSFLAALVFPDLFRIRQEFGDDEARANEVVGASLRETVRRFNEEQPVKYERLTAFAVIDRELTVDDHELTPSLKVRVRNVLESAEPFIEAIYDPSRDCDCRFLRKVMRLGPDDRPCFRGKDMTLDRCHECGPLIRLQSPGTGDEKEQT